MLVFFVMTRVRSFVFNLNHLFMNLNLKNKPLALRLLTEQIEKQGIDVAPTYVPYMEICFCIANDCGEPGREFFHRICRLSPKYNESDADRLYTNALIHGERKNGLRTLFHYAEKMSVDVNAVNDQLSVEAGLRSVDSFDSNDSRSFSRNKSDNGSEFSDEVIEGVDPHIGLATFREYEHPWPLNQLSLGTFSEHQRAARFLSTIAVLGSTLNYHLFTRYSGELVYPNLQVFVTGKAASGKSSIGVAKSFAMSRHKKCLEDNDMALEKYRHDMMIYKKLVKSGDDVSTSEPKVPKKKLFVIPGNNTGAGLIHNIVNSNGIGLIFEPEADTLSFSNKSQYGQFNDIMRKLHDNEGLSYSRRSDDEHEEIDKTCVGLVLSGTPEQIKNFVDSTENGLFSRQLFYYIPEIGHWVSQFFDDKIDVRSHFQQLADKWAKVLEKVDDCLPFELRLTEHQKEVLDAKFDRLYDKAQVMSKGEMNSSVLRMAMNLMRIMSVYAFLRHIEQASSALDKCVKDRNAQKDTNATEEFYITDEDFEEILSMADVFYQHTSHVLSFMNKPLSMRRPNIEKEMLFDSMGDDEFSLKDFMAKAKELGLKERTAQTWLYRDADSKNGIFERRGYTGEFIRRKKGGA